MWLYAKHILVGAAVLVPVAFTGGWAVYSGQTATRDLDFAFLNWLYMAAPQLVAAVVAVVSIRARRHFLPWALVASAVLVAAFQGWIHFFVPPREGALAWLLYIPLWIGMLALLGIALAWRYRRANEL